MKPISALTDDERFPLLKDRSLLQELRQSDCSPKFNFGSGDRLTAASLQKVKQYGENLKKMPFWEKGQLPPWIPDYLAWCIATVPAYCDYQKTFAANPSIQREAIAEKPWNFVSNECHLDDMLVYNTSGTTGAPMKVLCDPVSQAAWLPQLESILATDGITVEGGCERVSICLVCCQDGTLTYASLSTYLQGAGILKINLSPEDWNDPDDRRRYLEKYNPEILTGDPFTFLTLAELNPTLKPKAIISSAMAMQEGVRRRLEKQFHCPVYDIYSLTECRMIAVSKVPGLYTLIRPELYIEILHPDNDTPIADGERGEITVTGGINPFLPLIRYRTGDFATIRHNSDTIEICDLEGRQPTLFVTTAGKFINNIDISRAIGEFSLAGFTLHQHRNRSVEFTGWGKGVTESEITKTLARLFGATVNCSVNIISDSAPKGKKVRYSSEIDGADLTP